MWVKSGICYLLYLKSLPFVHVQREEGGKRFARKRRRCSP